MLVVRVPVTTLCPCSKAISKYGAHNQRSFVNVSIGSKDFIWIVFSSFTPIFSSRSL